MPQPSCPELKQQYAHILALKSEFDAALEEAARSGEFSRPQALKAKLEQMMAELIREVIANYDKF